MTKKIGQKPDHRTLLMIQHKIRLSQWLWSFQNIPFSYNTCGGRCLKAPGDNIMKNNLFSQVQKVLFVCSFRVSYYHDFRHLCDQAELKRKVTTENRFLATEFRAKISSTRMKNYSWGTVCTRSSIYQNRQKQPMSLSAFLRKWTKKSSEYLFNYPVLDCHKWKELTVTTLTNIASKSGNIC